MNQNCQNYPSEYPYKREWGINSVNIHRYMALENNWNISKKRIDQIRECLNNIEINRAVETVAAAGSIGRMEASKDVSDADLIVVLSNNINLESDVAKEAYNSVWEALKSLELPKPNSEGVFAHPTNQEQLLGSIGKADEKLDVFGKRLLLLLESQPVYREDNYKYTINSIVDSYADKYVKTDSKKEWTLLLNDLIRYFRAITVNYQWTFDQQPEKWTLRNIKLRHSRLVMYSGLLMLLGEASKERQEKVPWLKERLRMTPMERLAWVYEQNEDWNFHRIAGLYNVFLSKLSEEEVRKNLNVAYEERYNNPEFALLKANSDGLVAELLRFIFARRGSWSERFFEYLIF